MRKLLFSLTAMAALLTVVSCSKDKNEEGIDPNAPVEIRAGGTALDVSSNTRAPFEGIGAGKSGNLEARVIASNSNEAYIGTGVLVKDGRMLFTADGTAPKGFLNLSTGLADAAYYPHATNPVYLVGLYPHTGWTVDATEGKEAVRTFDGTNDVMAAAFVSTTRADAHASPSTYPTLTFNHLLTRLNITLEADGDAAITAWGEVTSLKLKSSNNTITVNLKAGTAAVGTAFTGTANFDCPKVVDNTVIATGNKIELKKRTDVTNAQKAYVLAAPVEVPAGGGVAYTLVVTTENFPTAREVPLTLFATNGTDKFDGDTQGKQFDIVLTFNATEIMAKATVTDWEKGGSGTAPIN